MKVGLANKQLRISYNSTTRYKDRFRDSFSVSKQSMIRKLLQHMVDREKRLASG